jgi:hypothetical protein
VDSCAEAARLSEQLGLTPLTRSLDLARLGQAHLVNKQPSDALPVFLRALELRPTTDGLDDLETADIRQVVAMTYVALGDAKGADEQLALSIATYEAGVELYPHQIPIRQRLHTAVVRYAQFKRQIGDETSARVLDARAASLAMPASDAPSPFHVVDGVPCIGPGAPHLTPEHMRSIRALVPPSSRGPWLVLALARSERRWSIRAYLEPDSVTPQIRRGRVLVAETALILEAGYDQPMKWQDMKIHMYYAQVPVKGRPATEVLGERDLNRPFNVFEPGPLALADQDVVSIVEFLRGHAAAGAATPPDANSLRTEIQPWPVQSIYPTAPVLPDTVSVTLTRGGTLLPRQQSITLRREGATWTIVELR